jgi:hypothetical protein
VGKKDRYHENRTRFFEIYGIEPSDRRYSCHHIIQRSDYKRNPRFWDSLEPSGRFDIDSVCNLCPLKKEEHADLHRRIAETTPLPVKKRKRGRRRR